MKRNLVLLCSIFLLFVTCSQSNATLTTIGTATYNGQNYNLIFDGELGSNGLVWLDYTNNSTDWTSQVAWAQGLSFSSVEVTIFSSYTTDIDWTTGWRLPSVGSNPQAGYNQTTSEMGHLFYEELDLEAWNALGHVTTSAELNASNFENLSASWYWFGTECANGPSSAWSFAMYSGAQGYNNKTSSFYGLAVHTGQVSAVPVPSAILLFGFGLLGLAGVSRRKK